MGEAVVGMVFSEDPTRIPESLRSVPLTGLSRQTRRKLSHALNALRFFHSEEGYERDWRGVASIALPNFCGMDKSITMNEDCFERVLKLWCELHPSTATFDALLNILMRLDRWDIADDIVENLGI